MSDTVTIPKTNATPIAEAKIAILTTGVLVGGGLFGAINGSIVDRVVVVVVGIDITGVVGVAVVIVPTVVVVGITVVVVAVVVVDTGDTALTPYVTAYGVKWEI
jgi:uncharacterized membrane protein